MKQDDPQGLSQTLFRQRQRSFARPQKSLRRMSATSGVCADDHKERTGRYSAGLLQLPVFQQFTERGCDLLANFFCFASLVGAVDLDNQSRSPDSRAPEVL
jgi:hypothetical protein